MRDLPFKIHVYQYLHVGNGDSTWPIFLFSKFFDVIEVREEILNLVVLRIIFTN